jgi:hypothetical protein
MGWHEVRPNSPTVVNPENRGAIYYADRIGVVFADSVDGRAICRFLAQRSARAVGRLSIGRDSEPLFVLAIPALGTAFQAFADSLKELQTDSRVHDVVALRTDEVLSFPGDEPE